MYLDNRVPTNLKRGDCTIIHIYVNSNEFIDFFLYLELNIFGRNDKSWPRFLVSDIRPLYLGPDLYNSGMFFFHLWPDFF